MEFSDAQLRILIDERKRRNAEYHATTNKKKYLFWNEIAEKINDQENTNYFTGDECHKKFLSLTKAFYTAEKQKKGSGTKKSLIDDEIYEEFSSRFWLKPEQVCNENVCRSGGSSSSSQRDTAVLDQPSSSLERKRSERSSKKTPKVIESSGETPVELRRPSTPSTIEPHTISRPITPTLPSFSQSANVINITINNNYSGAPDEQEE